MAAIGEASIDRVMATFLADRSGLTGHKRERLHYLVRSLFAALGEGHSCIELGDQDEALARSAKTVSTGDLTPLILSGHRLYLHRYYSYETRLAKNLWALARESIVVDGLDNLLQHWFPAVGGDPDWQREAARSSLTSRLSIISGGPGTGKTTTVVKIVGLLLACYGADFKIAVAAPTGKAAVRLQEALQQQLDGLPLSDEMKGAFPRTAQTLHRLLGVRRFSTGFNYCRSNPLLWDVVLVDEASMVDLALMDKLVDALRPGSRLILIGDKDQLASVASGAVLNDCIGALPDRVVVLRKRWRFDRRIALFADAVNSGDAARALEIMDGKHSAVTAAGSDWQEWVGNSYHQYLDAVNACPDSDSYQSLFRIFSRFRVLCALRNGIRGADGLNAWIEGYFVKRGHDGMVRQWYPGRPVIITRNDYGRSLFNGDIGLCLRDPERRGELAVWFEQPGGSPRSYPPALLPPCETAWAMTIHKSQGSEFDEVAIVLPEADNQILCRELLYTGVTRAGKRVVIQADRDAICAAINRRTERFGGLSERLLSERKNEEEIDA